MTKMFNFQEAVVEYLNGNPELGNTDPVTTCRGTTIVGSYVMYQSYGGVTWQQTFYTDSSTNVVAISAATTV